MAINETIVTGRKFRKLIDESTKLWQRISIWSKASDVEFDDGKNAETKIGAINGVTDSLTSTSSNIAASAKAVKELNDKVTQLSSNIGRPVTYAEKTGTVYTYVAPEDGYYVVCWDSPKISINGVDRNLIQALSYPEYDIHIYCGLFHLNKNDVISKDSGMIILRYEV